MIHGDAVKQFDVLKVHTKSHAIRLNILIQLKATFLVKGAGSTTRQLLEAFPLQVHP